MLQLVTVEPPNKGHFRDTASVLILEVVLFSEVINVMVKGPGGVSFVGRSSLSQRVLNRRFHCIASIASAGAKELSSDLLLAMLRFVLCYALFNIRIPDSYPQYKFVSQSCIITMYRLRKRTLHDHRIIYGIKTSSVHASAQNNRPTSVIRILVTHPMQLRD